MFMTSSPQSLAKRLQVEDLRVHSAPTYLFIVCSSVNEAALRKQRRRDSSVAPLSVIRPSMSARFAF
jgi:hypothetical protein